MDNNIQQGQLKRWNDDKGFGFIKAEGRAKDIFLHISALKGSSRRPKEGDTILYRVHTENDGKTRAFDARIAGVETAKPTFRQQRRKQRKKGRLSAIIFLPIIFILIVSASVVLGFISSEILPYYLAMSVITFLWYWKDKSAAQNDDWRTPESTLQMLSLLGGWPGGLMAQQILRHKSTKHSFQSTFWATVILNCGVFVWFHTSDGRDVLNNFIQTITMLVSSLT